MHLLPFTERHFEMLSGWFRDPRELAQWGGTALAHPLDRTQLNHMLDEGGFSPPARLCWMAGDDAGNAVGHAQLAFDWRDGVARMCRVAIDPHKRGEGLAVPMLRAVMEKAFSHRQIERVELNVYSWNKAAIRTYLRLGFVQEGIRRSSARVGSERWDTVMMGILRPEWLKTEEAGSSVSMGRVLPA
ncbi:GNAT family N-acetyltransferase [Gluconacetobacter tumulisoli]|uniref:GNAT family N-acetyltransferase n=1 Tax=Gluconacetobacter tumulisoli TaxID=1286189 RepID=A0A7W4K478_9PROT|nr:GNAT family N-acetyltransferase [Gluconacetobacter tumulisoli]